MALVLTAAVIAGIVLNTARGPTRPPNSGRTTAAVSARKTTTPHKRIVGRRTAPRITGVARLTLTLSEPSSASIATGRSASGEPVRLLPTSVRYPRVGTRAGRVRFPLVVFSQGFDEPVSGYSGLLNAWARAGYVVAAPTYPLTDPSSPGGVNESDIVNHPADLRFVISALKAAAGNARSPLYGVIDPRAVAIAGQSDGGDVSLAVAANSCCRDSTVKAAMILSGAELTAFGGAYYAGGGNPPLLVVQGSADPINVPGCSAQLYNQAAPPKYYLDLAGAQHLPPYTDPGPTRRGVERTTIAFLDKFLKRRAESLGSARLHLPRGEILTTESAAPRSTNQACPGAP